MQACQSFLHTFKFKYEDIKIAEEMVEKVSFLFAFDLKNAYHSIDINRKNRSLLDFAAKDGGKTKWYVFNSLTFGIASAGHIFSKVLKGGSHLLEGERSQDYHRLWMKRYDQAVLLKKLYSVLVFFWL